MNAHRFPSEIIEMVSDGALVVSGSRSIKDDTQWARMAINAARERKMCIVVGDAGGVDATVIRMARFLGYPAVVLGTERYGLRLKVNNSCVGWLVPAEDRPFLVRDEALVELALLAPAYGFLGNWDGQSTGTIYTKNFAKRNNVPGALYCNDRMIERWMKK